MTLRGGPDWGIPPLGAASKGADPGGAAEYAAFGFNRLDGLGRPILVETWRQGLGGWVTSIGAGGVLPALRNDGAFVPPAYVRLDAGTGANGVSASAAQREWLIGATTTLGLELAFRGNANDPDFVLDLSYQRPDLPTRYIVRLQWQRVLNVLQLVHSTGVVNLVNFATARWGVLKVKGDYQSGLYVSARVGDVFFDLSAFGLVVGPPGTPEYAAISARATKAAANNEIMDIGYIVVTRDEP